MTTRLFSSESVAIGHPDLVMDRIADSILQAHYSQDTSARVAVEGVVSENLVVLTGEITSEADVTGKVLEDVVRQSIRESGYTRPEDGFSAESANIHVFMNTQSPDIAQGVVNEDISKRGYGDQGIAFGYATNETRTFLPPTIHFATQLSRAYTDLFELFQKREDGMNPLRPDAKTQVTMRFIEDETGHPVPVGIDTILISASHSEAMDQPQIRELLIQDVITPVLNEAADYGYDTSDIKILTNPTGRFVIHGPKGDAGSVSRKLVTTQYGGVARMGGGGLVGKDLTKSDRSLPYMTRYAAVNLVAAGMCDRCEIQIATAIGVPEPISIFVETFGTAKVPQEELQRTVEGMIDWRAGYVKQLLDDMIAKTEGFRFQNTIQNHFFSQDLPWNKPTAKLAIR